MALVTKSRVFAAAMAVSGTGCGSDEGLTDHSGGGTDGNGVDGGQMSDGDDGEGPDSSAGTSGATAATDPSGGDSTGGGGPSLGCTLDCGNGFCDFDGDAEFCVCPNGEAAVGLTCLPCAKHDGGVLADIGTISIAVEVTIDGDAPPQSLAEHGELVLVDRLRGDEAVVGDTATGNVLAATVIPGDYELYWRHVSGGSFVPKNKNALLGRVGIDAAGQLRVPADTTFGTDTGTLVVDIVTVDVDIDVSFNETVAPQSQAENGALRLLDPSTGDEVPLGETATDDLAARMLPGTYELHYAAQNTASVAPRNPDAYVLDMDIYDSGPIAVTIPVVTLEGEFRVDGALAPDSTAERGRVALRDTLTGAEIDLGFTNAQTYSVPVVPGDYELVYRHVQGAGIVPRNTSAILETIAAQPRPVRDRVQAYDVEIPTLTISGAFTVGDALPPSDSANVGDITLRSPDSDDEVALGETSAGAYDVRVIPAAYDIFYSQKTSSGLVPANTNALLASVDLQMGQLPGDIDVPFAPVTGAVMLNGAPPPASEYDDGRIYLRNTQTGDSVLLGNTRLGSVDGLVVPGTYDVFYVVETAGDLVPQNTGAYLDTVVVGSGAGLDLPLDISAFDLVGMVTVGGGPAPGSATDQGLLTLEDVASDDTIFLGGVDTLVSAPLTAGTYVLYFQMLQTSGALPANQRAGLACYVLGD